MIKPRWGNTTRHPANCLFLTTQQPPETVGGQKGAVFVIFGAF
jgi:hypothetical protein